MTDDIYTKNRTKGPVGYRQFYKLRLWKKVIIVFHLVKFKKKVSEFLSDSQFLCHTDVAHWMTLNHALRENDNSNKKKVKSPARSRVSPIFD